MIRRTEIWTMFVNVMEDVQFYEGGNTHKNAILPVKAGVTLADIPDFQWGGTELSVEGNPILAEKILIDPVQYLDRTLARSCNKVITQLMRSQIKQTFGSRASWCLLFLYGPHSLWEMEKFLGLSKRTFPITGIFFTVNWIIWALWKSKI